MNIKSAPNNNEQSNKWIESQPITNGHFVANGGHSTQVPPAHYVESFETTRHASLGNSQVLNRILGNLQSPVATSTTYQVYQNNTAPMESTQDHGSRVKNFRGRGRGQRPWRGRGNRGRGYSGHE